MATNFPTTIDTFVNPNAAAGNTLASVPHDLQHANINDAVAALQAKVGVDGSAVTTSIDYQLKAGGLVLNATNTAGGVTGAQTINKPSGTVNFAAAATSLVVTNSLVAATSIVLAVVRTDDTTAVIKNVVPAAGSFTIRLNAAATAETSVGFIVFNGAAPSFTPSLDFSDDRNSQYWMFFI